MHRSPLSQGLRARRISFFLVFIVSALFAVNSAIASALPSWVLSPPADDAFSIYGVGEAPNLNDATQQALRSIAGKLSTRIRSDSIGESGISGGTATRHYQETVQSSIEDIHLSSYQVRQTELVGGRYFMLIELSRQDFARDTRLRLEKLSSELTQALSFGAGSGPFDHFIACQQVPGRVEEGLLLVRVLSAVDGDFDAASGLKLLNAHEQRCAEAMQGLTLRLAYDPRLRPVAEAVANGLSIRTVAGGRADAQLRVEAEVSNREIFNSKSVVVNLSVALVDNRNAVVARQDYQFNGASVASFDSALADAQRKFLSQGGAESILSDLRLR